MTPQEMEFVEKLSPSDREILGTILKHDKVELQNYLEFLKLQNIEKNNVCDNDKKIKQLIEQLTRNIPMDYLPIMGIPFNYRCQNVYEYIHFNIFDKRYAFYPKQIEKIDSTLPCFFSYLEEKIRAKKTFVGVSGVHLLEDDLTPKIDLVLEQRNAIYTYLKESGVDFIFNGNTRAMYLENLKTENNFKNFEHLVKILAMYSHLEDLELENIESFQKFVRIKK